MRRECCKRASVKVEMHLTECIWHLWSRHTHTHTRTHTRPAIDFLLPPDRLSLSLSSRLSLGRLPLSSLPLSPLPPAVRPSAGSPSVGGIAKHGRTERKMYSEQMRRAAGVFFSRFASRFLILARSTVRFTYGIVPRTLSIYRARNCEWRRSRESTDL